MKYVVKFENLYPLIRQAIYTMLMEWQNIEKIWANFLKEENNSKLYY